MKKEQGIEQDDQIREYPANFPGTFIIEPVFYGINPALKKCCCYKKEASGNKYFWGIAINARKAYRQ
jgi:hypothetical protein